MLFQLILDIIVFILKMVLWVVMGLVAIPFGIYMLLQHLLPIFTHEASFWFWALFAACTLVAYYVLWKPLLWIVGVVSVLGAGQ